MEQKMTEQQLIEAGFVHWANFGFNGGKVYRKVEGDIELLATIYPGQPPLIARYPKQEGP